MKVVKALLIVLLTVSIIGGVIVGVYLFLNRDKGPTPDEVSDSVVALCDEASLRAFDAGQEGIIAVIKAKEQDEEKEREEEEKRRQEEEEGDEDDPVNDDSTKDTGKSATTDAMTKRYVGTWEQQGVLQGDGNLDTSTGSSCTYVFNADYTYTAKGKDINGKTINENGTWKLNANKQIVAGGYTMGIDESGYMLKDTGERDGKGRKMRYAFSKN